MRNAVSLFCGLDARVPSQIVLNLRADRLLVVGQKKVILDVSTPVLGRVVVEGTLLINASANVNLSAVWLEIKGGKLIIATLDPTGEKVLGPFTGQTTLTMHGTNDKLSALHGPDPRETPEVVLGTEGVPMGPATIGVSGTMIALGKPTSHSWTGLATSASSGDTSLVLEGEVDWPLGAEITISPTDFDMHQAEVKRITAAVTASGRTNLTLDSALLHDHYSEATRTYGTRSLRMQARVGLLSRNIVIQGHAQGEELSYHDWNAQAGMLKSDAVCGNGRCENGETSLTCNDCKGPAYEFGTAILVASYSEEITYCDRNNECTAGVSREFSENIFLQMDSVELRYYGQNNIRPGIEFRNIVDNGPNCTVSNVALNRGYFYAMHVHQSHGVTLRDNVFYRSHLPSIKVEGGEGNRIIRNLGVVGIFWNTHRGAIQGKGMFEAKLNAMIGMFHDRGKLSVFEGNVAAGSERAGFSGPGVACSDFTSFVGNEAHSCLAGYWLDFFNSNKYDGCTAVHGVHAWKIHLYGIYAEPQKLETLEIRGARIADAAAGTYVVMGGVNALAHQRMEQIVRITDALYVGRSNNQDCQIPAPGLFTCQFYMVRARMHREKQITNAFHLSLSPSLPPSLPFLLSLSLLPLFLSRSLSLCLSRHSLSSLSALSLSLSSLSLLSLISLSLSSLSLSLPPSLSPRAHANMFLDLFVLCLSFVSTRRTACGIRQAYCNHLGGGNHRSHVGIVPSQVYLLRCMCSDYHKVLPH